SEAKKSNGASSCVRGTIDWLAFSTLTAGLKGLLHPAGISGSSRREVRLKYDRPGEIAARRGRSDCPDWRCVALRWSFKPSPGPPSRGLCVPRQEHNFLFSSGHYHHRQHCSYADLLADRPPAALTRLFPTMDLSGLR